MAESTPTPSPSPSADDMNWNLVHFRDDLQGVKSEIRDFRKDTADRFGEVRKEFGEIRREFGEKLDGVHREIIAVRQESNERVERSEARTASQFRWTYGLILPSWLSLVGMILPLHFRP